MVLGDIVEEKFQCDKMAQLGVLSLINHPHAATAEFFNDAIVRDSLAEHGRGSASWNFRRDSARAQTS